MHIAINGWFYDQESTGSGQYLRQLLANLRKAAPELELSLILPPHIPPPSDLPQAINVVRAGASRLPPNALGGPRGVGKVFFEQRTFPRIARQLGADIATSRIGERRWLARSSWSPRCWMSFPCFTPFTAAAPLPACTPPSSVRRRGAAITSSPSAKQPRSISKNSCKSRKTKSPSLIWRPGAVPPTDRRRAR